MVKPFVADVFGFICSLVSWLAFIFVVVQYACGFGAIDEMTTDMLLAAIFLQVAAIGCRFNRKYLRRQMQALLQQQRNQ